MKTLINRTKEKPERGHDGPKSVITKCRTLLSSEEMDINYTTTTTIFLQCSWMEINR